jgi:cell fate regulator YaaT (PSP1 superfamily)
MSIFPLPQFEADLAEALSAQDKAAYEALKPPKSLVVRFGSMKLIGEFPYQGAVKPGCGSRVVVRTFRGTELGEMLTSTCPNSGCSKSVSRKDMLRYIENSGGRDYPFFTDGKVLRIATPDDLRAQEALEQSRHELRLRARDVAQRLKLHCKIVDVEPILGGESITVFYLSEERIELRDLVRELGAIFRTRVDMRHVGARDEARLTADYEKCGQYCCCKNFLKVLRPISMKSAKVQKATLDPLKISGRCGRLMCCLRYEDETYEDLRKKLPRKKSRVGTPEGDGIVLDTQILTQLVLVELDALAADGKVRQIAVPVEELTPPSSAVAAPRPAPPPPRERPQRAPAPAAPGAPRPPRGEPRAEPRPSQPRADQPRSPQPQPRPPQPPQRPPQTQPPRSRDDEIDELLGALDDDLAPPPNQPPGHKRRRRRRRPGAGPSAGGPGAPPNPGPTPPDA